jgi:hypothetical protein
MEQIVEAIGWLTIVITVDALMITFAILSCGRKP